MNLARPKPAVADLRLGYWSGRGGSFAPDCDGLGFEVAENESIAVVGPSGCGKTTFLTALAKLTPVASGPRRESGRSADPPFVPAGLARVRAFGPGGVRPLKRPVSVP